MYGKKYPITVYYRKGDVAVFKNENLLLLDLFLQNKLFRNSEFELNYDIGREIVTIVKSNDDKKVRLHDSLYNGDIWGIFLDNDYKFLPVTGKTVVDIGANIGDSSIYFALQGAGKILAIEPFPTNYHVAKKNIQINDFSEKINVLLAGCARDFGFILIDRDYKSDAYSTLQEFHSGIKIPLFTLDYIFKEFDLPKDSILKMDCEGCEYEVILSSPPDILKKFSHIQIEYHFGYKNIKKKLESSGFRVRYDGPILGKRFGKPIYFGFIYASRD